jgi:hypothetical protein
MNVKDWQKIGEVKGDNLELKAAWYRVVEHVAAGKLLKFDAKGEWAFFPGFAQKCGPDGFLGLPIPDARLMLPNAPVGALIGKIGGSTADQKDGTLFSIGSFSIFAVPEKAGGPVYFGLNAIPGAPILKLEKIDLTVTLADP